MSKQQHRSRNLPFQLWVCLFVLSLSLSVIGSSCLPLYSQSSPQNLHDLLVEEIQKDVVRHYDLYGKPLEHSSIKELYWQDAQAAGLSYEELIERYEKEYSKNAASQKPSPLEQFRPNMGWLIGVLSTAMLAYVTLLQQWIEARVQDINDWLYGKLSGTQIFRGIALRKYREALVKNYKQLPMPFLRNRAPLEMDEVYVPLKVADSNGGIIQAPSNQGIQKNDHIDAYEAIANCRRLMVVGEPGSGKSVLLKHMAWSYGLGKLDWLSDRPVVILLDLYRLSDPDLDEATLIQALVDTFDRNQFPNAEQFVSQALDSSSLMLLLDGLDEVNSEVRVHVVQVIRDMLKKHRDCRIVITCRTAIYKGEFIDIVERKLEVVEFSDLQIRRFLKAWEPDLQQARKSVNQLMAALRERPLILKLARNPLLLTLVAYLYAEPAFVLPRSRAEFYHESIRILLEQREYKGDDHYRFNHYEPNEKRRVLQHLALHIQDHSEALKDRRSIKADVAREQIRQILPSLDIRVEKAGDILAEIVERSGLFMEIDGGERYLFPHLTLQEYFAAAALKEDQNGLINRFQADPTAWREVTKLWCSLVNDSTTIVDAVYQRDAIAGFECLAEARTVEQALADQIINYFKHTLDQPQFDDTLAQAFGAVAANERLRGKAVFSFLEQVLLDTQAPKHRRISSASALSKTNLPRAVEVLLRWNEYSQIIVSMGDLAVPGLAKLSKQGQPLSIKAIDDLFAIGTPDAANALVPLLWSDHENSANRAAWYLAVFLRQSDIEDVLREYPLTPELEASSPRHNWIWSPFNKPNNPALACITGQIAYVLEQASPSSIPNISLRLDPRLVIPLCAIQMKPNALPQRLPKSAEQLLEQQIDSPQLHNQCLNEVQTILAQQSNLDEQWKLLLSTLPPTVQLDLLSQATHEQQPTRYQWRNLFQVTDYELRTGWHYQVILLIHAVLSIAATIQAGIIAFTTPTGWGISLSSVVIIINLLFWQTLGRGIDQPFSPLLFQELGPLGIFTLLRQWIQLSNRNLIWYGIELLHRTLTKRYRQTITIAIFGAITITFVGAIFGTITFASAVGITGAVAVVSPVAVFFIVTDVYANEVAFALAFAVAFVLAFTVTSAGTVNVTLAVFVAVAVVSVVSGAALGLENWYQPQTSVNSDLRPILALLAFPWFCWFPLMLSLGSVALYHLLSTVSFNSSLVWVQTILVTLIIAGVGSALWWRGKYLENRGKNPFQEGAIGQILGARQ
ncbi:MAG: NACHT domain-containing protein [Cyanobacteria bacterium P01_F01_bin.150]